MKRRNLLLGSGAAMLIGLIRPTLRAQAQADGGFRVSRTPEEWKTLLTDAQYTVLRRQGTERPYSSPLNKEKRAGLYHCAGCDQPLYSSEHKYDSRTGWPSFWQARSGAIGTRIDNSMFMPRIECHCSRCGGHLGHIFDDGPRPTGKRHCLNGVALTFKPGQV